MDINTAFTDTALEEDGTWIKYRDGSSLLLARIGNPKFQRRLEAKMKPHRRKERAGTLDNATETRVLCEAISETILLDWKGFTKNKKAFAYTKEAAFDLLMKSIDFRNEVTEMATSEENFRAEELETDVKNS